MKENLEYGIERQNAAELLAELLNEADAIVIGAGAGLSASAGFTYSGERFYANFADFAQKYGFRDMYSGGFYPFGSDEEFWAYWSRYIYINRYDQPAGKPYEDLLAAVKDKNYFVITTNVDHRFQVAGFDKLRLFYTQGDYGLFQCSVPCHDRTYDNEAAIRAMIAAQKDMKISSELIPRCPVCGKPMTLNLRSDDRFAEDDGWRAACGRYEAFLNGCEDKKTLYLELGVGLNTPGIIKFPFWRAVRGNDSAKYVSVDISPVRAPFDLPGRMFYIDDDIGAVLARVRPILQRRGGKNAD